MESERLEPLETLEKDYYLGERNGWYSDGEQRDSESSDDELREQLRELAGMRCKSRKEKQHERMQKKDKFELDMDSELSENFVAHASKIFSSSSKENSENLEIIDENEMDAESSGSKTMEDETIANNDIASSANKNSSNKPVKSVTFEKQPDELMNTDRNSKSSFDDDNNLLRKASKKAANEAKNETVEFYDSDEDEDNERWVRHHREQMKIVKSLNSSSNEDGGAKQKKDHETDAVLSCPACMSLLTRDCQKHELYHNQYRAIFVENCNVVENEVLFLPQSGRNKRKSRKNAAGIKPNAIVDPANVTTLPKEDLFHPVLCSVCATNVGVYDYEEIFHFFNVLTGYA